MIYLLAFFVPPLALLLIGKWFQAILNLVLYVVAFLLFLLTIVFGAPGALIVWGICVLHAILAINAHKADRRNRQLIEAARNAKS